MDLPLPLSLVGNAIDPSIADDVIPLCELAKNLEEAGEFDRAADRFALGFERLLQVLSRLVLCL